MATCYINPDPVYRPQTMHISSITKANPAVITTEIDHNYVTGLIVHFRLYSENNMSQINDKILEITVTGDTTFTVPIDSTTFDAYVDGGDGTQCGQVVPVGENNSILTMATKNILTR